MTYSPSIVAVVVTYNSELVIEPCVRALLAQSVRTIVVDNNSQDNGAKKARQLGATVIKLGENVGFGAANNIGARAAAAPWVLFINPDAVIANDAINELLLATQTYVGAGIFGPRLVEPSGRVFLQARSRLSTYLHNEKSTRIIPAGDCCVPFLSGACLLVKRDLFLAIGGFDPEIFLFYEDDDLCRRVADLGQSIIFVDRAIVTHSRGKSCKSSDQIQFLCRANLAWSNGYIERKYGLQHRFVETFLVSGFKWLFALMTFNKRGMIRHGGTFWGNWLSFRKKNHPALTRHSIEPSGRDLKALN
jgi:N-acetylglucosaminyl-diphospho-decaprenol L-rhamnosyltransferase